jgi:GT2 family glycosyltransferase
MKTSIIILSYNTKKLLKDCLTSLSLLNPPPLQVIVVDNASADGSPQMVLSDFPQVTLIKNQTNVGFAAANNQAIKIASGNFVMLLNSDTQIVDPHTLGRLEQFLLDHPQAAIVTPKVVLNDGRIDLACHRGMPTPWNALTYFTGLSKVFPRTKICAGYHQTYKDLTRTHQVDATAATAILVSRKAIDQVGLLDESFFLYGEDLDWCKRFTDSGWEIWYDPQITINHYKSASGKKKQAGKHIKSASVNYFYDTMKLFYEKHYHTKYPKWLRHLIYMGIDLKKKLHH